jgi:Protein of unknown function (DUF2569)
VNREYETYPRYKGIGGWLAIFVIVLTLIFPLSTLYRAAQRFQEIRTASQLAPRILLLAIADCAARTLLALLSIYCGIALLRKSRRAVAVTKKFLIILFVYFATLDVVSSVLTSARWWNPDSPRRSLFAVLLGHLVFFTIWYAYLSRSERVASTYRNSDGLTTYLSLKSPPSTRQGRA